LKGEHTDAIRIYVALWGDWITAREQLRQIGTLVRNPNGKGAMASPFVRLAQDAMKGLREMQTTLLFGPGTREGRSLGREQTKLERFLASKRR
jgi:phage terminase small subunit